MRTSADSTASASLSLIYAAKYRLTWSRWIGTACRNFFSPASVSPMCKLRRSLSPSAEAFILAGAAVGIGFATAQPALQALAIDLAAPAERGTAMATFWAFTDFGVINGSFVSGQIAAVSALGTVFGSPR